MNDKIKQLVIDVEWEFLKKADDAKNVLQRYKILVQAEKTLCFLDDNRSRVRLEIYKGYVRLLTKQVKV
jgi:hypothetical protein